MKCNKCGTPIISGENRCRFCGSTIVIKKPEVIKEPELIIDTPKKPEIIKEIPKAPEVKKEVIMDTPKKPEIIMEVPKKEVIMDVPKKPEIIMEVPKKEVIMDAPKKAEIIREPLKPEIIKEIPKVPEEKKEASKKAEVIMETPKVPEIIMNEPEKIEIIEEVKKDERKEIDVTDELEKTARLERIDLEEFTGKIDREEIKNIVIETNVEETLEPKKEIKQVVEKAFHEKANNFMTFSILICVLAASLTLNGYLYINRYKLATKEAKKISENTRTVYYDNYELNIPDNWNTKGIATNNNMLIFDDTNEWGATIEILKNSVFEHTEQYKDDINNSFMQKGYTFTSSYNKETEEMDFYIYKGKYNAYSVYLIVGKINDENAIVTDLKFKGEVNKEILDNVLDVVSNIDSNTLQDFYESDFDFNQVGNLVKEKIKIADGVVQ
jgi:hypothetical protein